MQTTDVQVEIQQLIDQGIQLRKDGKLKEAISSFQQAIKSDDQAYKAYHFLGETLAQQDKLEAAAEAYRKGIAINPDYYWYYHCLGLVLFWQGQVDEAIAAAKKAIEIESDKAVFHYQLGQYLERKLDWDSAISAYSYALELEPSLTEARQNLERVLVKQSESGEKDRREVELKTILSQGRQLMEQGDFDIAIALYQQGIDLDANSDECYHFLGEALAKKNELKQAENCYRQAININPDYSWSYHNLAQVLFWQGQIDDAIANCHQAIQIEPNEAVFYFQLGKSLDRRGDLEQAIIAYQQAINLDTTSSSYECYHFLGEALAKKNELKQAEDCYYHAININPNYCWSYYCLGKVLLWQGQIDDAIAYLEQAIEIEPSKPEFQDQLRLAQIEKKETKNSEPLNIESLIKQGTEGIYSRIADRFYWELKAKANYPIPPQKLIEYCGSNSITHYIDNMLLYNKDIIQQCMLKRNHKVLEIGCGAGRIANGLFHYLNQEGEYWGLDVAPEAINWCKKFITTRNSNFKFQQLPVINNYYYQENNNQINHYNFDFLGERKFDCIFAVATFNHLRLEDTQQYLQEVGTRLNRNGVAYFTFFIIDEDFFEFREKTKLHHGLKKDSSGVWYGYKRQSSFTGYEVQTLKELLDNANLNIITYHPGNWAQKKKSRLYQDWLLVERAS